MGTVLGIHHVSMKCETAAELEKAVAFYRDVLRLPLVREWPDGAMLDAGDGVVELSRGAGEHCRGVIGHFALRTDDTDALVRRVEAAGYAVFVQPKDIAIPSDPPYPARIAFCTGPLGEEIEFFQER